MEARFARLVYPLIGLVVVYGCNPNKKEPFKKVSSIHKNILRFPIATNILTLDPSRCNDLPTYQLLMQIFEGLVRIGPDNNVEPALAEKWDISSDQKTYTFYLNKKAKFHNGKSVGAEDVIWSFERCCNPEEGSPNAKTYFSEILGVNNKLSGKAQNIAGLQLIDSSTFSITLETPKAYFIKNLSLPIAFILPKNQVPNTEITQTTEMIGTGPFKIKDYAPGQSASLMANDIYYCGRPKVDEIRISIVRDSAMAINLYKSGVFDICKVPQIAIDGLKKDPQFKDQLHIYSFSSVYYLELNAKAYKPFQDPRVRRAFGMAVDRGLYSRTMLSHIATKATSIIAKNVPGHRKQVKEVAFDPIKARQLLAEAGYKDGSKLPPLDIYLCTDAPTAKKVTENVALQLKKNLRVPISVRTLEWGAFCSKVQQKNVPFRFAGWTVNCIDPANYLSHLFTTKSQLNYCNYSNPEFDRLCEKADSQVNQQDRLKLYAKAEDLLFQDGIIYPLYYPIDAYLIRKEAKGFEVNMAGFMPYSKVRIENDNLKHQMALAKQKR